MTVQEARVEINSRPDLVLNQLQKSKGSNQYICPVCGSGGSGGARSDGALTFYPENNRFYCFACSDNDKSFGGKGQDVLGALRLIWGCTEAEVFERVGINISTIAHQKAHRAAQNGFTESGHNNAPPIVTEAEAATQELTEPIDLTTYYAECRNRLKNSPEAIAYLQGRGISLETAVKYWIGFDPKADPADSNHPTARLIIPTSRTHYVARSINPNQKDWTKLNNKGGKAKLFNEDALYSSDNDTVFVTEGFFDALSIIEVGETAIALNSTSNAKKLLSLLQNRRTDATLILCFDNDEAGRKCTKTISKGLQGLNISYVKADISGGHNDPNEHLQANREAFSKAVQDAIMLAERPDNINYYINALMTKEISELKEGRIEKTGFNNFDELTGGLYAGLYVIAAGSSIGKTTFCIQLADQLATLGNDVLFFSMEQSRLEIVSKSLARRAAQENIKNAPISLQIRQWNFKKEDPDKKAERVLRAADAYSNDIGGRLSIIEGNFDCNCTLIGKKIRDYVSRTGAKPVVILDYLQILQPEQDKNGRTQTTKETVDSVITELKRLSRELKITVIAISSINRTAYYTNFSMESLKESGNIEYTADVIMGLQLQCMNDNIFNSPPSADLGEKKEILEAAKAESPRKIELKVVKNRYGVATFKMYFDYYCLHDLFIESVYSYDDGKQPRKRGRKVSELER